jgi:peroxiredoxin
MGTVKLGDTLPNYSFEDIDGQRHLLSQLVTDRTIITYLKPDCDACLTELEHLRSAAVDSADFARVLLISTANPLNLQRLKADYGLGCRVLYDEERFFGSALNIQSFPFNLVIDRNRVILEIHANPLLKADYERLFSVGRVHETAQAERPTIIPDTCCFAIDVGYLTQLVNVRTRPTRSSVRGRCPHLPRVDLPTVAQGPANGGQETRQTPGSNPMSGFSPNRSMFGTRPTRNSWAEDVSSDCRVSIARRCSKDSPAADRIPDNLHLATEPANRLTRRS